MEGKQPPEQPRRRLTAEEVRSKYGSGALLLLAWEIWCIRDGWFHPDPHYEYIGFSRFMATSTSLRRTSRCFLGKCWERHCNSA